MVSMNLVIGAWLPHVCTCTAVSIEASPNFISHIGLFKILTFYNNIKYTTFGQF